MKKTISYFLIIIIGNILFILFYFTQDLYRMVALFAIIALAYAIFKFTDSLSQLFFRGRSFSKEEINSNQSHVMPMHSKKLIVISAIILVILIGLHIGGYWIYFKNENDDLSNKGIYTPAIITDKKLETRPNHPSGYYIYYSYKYNSLIYRHNCRNDTLKKGDTIVVKFSPDNPDHHIVMDKAF